VNKTVMLMRILRDAENDMAVDLLKIGERHKADHEIYHLTRDLARWSHEHVRLLSEAATQMGATLDPDADEPGPLTAVREKTAELLGRRPEPGLLLLRDLRKLHLDAVGLSVDWEVLGQTAQATKNDSLLELVQRCHPDTLRQARWANTMIKVLSPQIMAS
jgi:hypothetical protein